MSEVDCTLTDEELVVKAKEWLDELIKTGGRKWSLPVPANPNNDVDLIFAELIERFKEKIIEPFIKKEDDDT